GGPVRKFYRSFYHHPYRAHGGGRSLVFPLAHRADLEYFQSDRHGHADRAGDAEWDPDSGVRQSAAGAWNTETGSHSAGCRKQAAAHPDDECYRRPGSTSHCDSHGCCLYQPDGDGGRDHWRIHVLFNTNLIHYSCYLSDVVPGEETPSRV